LQEGDPGRAADQRQTEAGKNAFAEGLQDGRQQDDESVEDEEMQQAGVFVPEHPGVHADVGEDASNTLGDIVDPVLIGSQPQHSIELSGPNGEVGDGSQQDRQHRDRLHQRHLW
jgi:hypothetical protein